MYLFIQSINYAAAGDASYVRLKQRMAALAGADTVCNYFTNESMWKYVLRLHLKPDKTCCSSTLLVFWQHKCCVEHIAQQKMLAKQ